MRFAREMAFYSAYHQEKRNVYIHIFGVPLISFSFLVICSWLSVSIGGFDISLAMVLTIGVLLYYFSLDVPFSLVATIVFGGILFAADFVANNYPTWIGWSIFGAGQIIGWGSQIYGHMVFEKSRPAFLDNLFQALVSAPLFVIADVFFEFGIRKELQNQVKDQLKDRGLYKKEFDMA
ncbi:MAG: DUF962 domain-containing protein [Leptospira sp.]|nr:DUF962 domain-containing protein [Leptospira sp.]